MSSVEQHVRQARQRLTGILLADRICVGLLMAATAWVATTLIVRLLALPVPVWHAGWVAALVGITIGTVWTVVTRPTLLTSAVTLDAAAGLKERLSTALVVARQSDDAWAQAAVQDAEAATSRVHVRSQIRWQAPALLPWSTATVLAALLLAWLMPTVGLFQQRDRDKVEPVNPAAVENERKAIAEQLEQKTAKLRALAEKRPELKDLAKDLKALDLPKDPTATPEDVRREAVKKIDDVKTQLDQKLATLQSEAVRDIKDRLQKLNQGEKTQNDKLSESLAKGDFAAARDELQKSMEELKSAAEKSSDPAAKQKLGELEQKMQKLSDQLNKLSDSQTMQKELEHKLGLNADDAKKMLDELSKMDPKQLEKELQKRLGERGLNADQINQLTKKIAQDQQARQAMQKLAQSLAKASQACQQCQGNNPGQGSGAAKQGGGAMADAMSQLSNLELSEQMMGELQAELSDIQNLRQGVCEGNFGQCEGELGSDRIGMQGGNYGRGLGERIGRQTTAYQQDPTKANTRFNSGAVIGQILINGPQVGGEASAEALATAASDLRDAQDAVDRQEVPRQYDHVLREYFDRVAGLVKQRQSEATKEPQK